MMAMMPDAPLLARAWRVLDRGYDWLVICAPWPVTIVEAQSFARHNIGRRLRLEPILLTRSRPAAAPRPARPAPATLPPAGPIAA